MPALTVSALTGPTLTVPVLTGAIILVAMLASVSSDSAALSSAYSAADLELSTDPSGAVWAKAPRVTIDRDYVGQPIAGSPTEVRSRWTNAHLYLLYICPYDELNLKPSPDLSAETPRLWNWDVSEAFIGSSADRITRYKEFQVSPQGEWVDLDIDRDDPKGQAGAAWNSGFTVAARIDAQAKIWYGVMRIPFSAIDTRPAEKGREFPAGLYRIAGVGSQKKYYAWRQTGQTSFHVPQAFGKIRLE
jgi:hypothetical protein